MGEFAAFSILYYSKLNVIGFWAVTQTTHAFQDVT